MNSKEEQPNSEVTNLENESLIQQQKDTNYKNEQIVDKKLNEKSMAHRIRKTPKNEYNAFVKIYLNTFIPKCSFNRLEQHQNCYYQK